MHRFIPSLSLFLCYCRSTNCKDIVRHARRGSYDTSRKAECCCGCPSLQHIAFTVETANAQVKGAECESLQGQCEELQHDMDCLQAEHAKVGSLHGHECLLFHCRPVLSCFLERT